MKILTAQVPHPIIQSQMFLPTLVPVSPYERRWTNELGDKCYMLAPRTLNHYDMVTLLGYLHVAQRSTIEKTEAGNRYRIEMPMSSLYEVLRAHSSSQRANLWDSLLSLSKTSYHVKYAKPAKHNNTAELVLAGITGDLQLVRRLGRGGSRLIAYPLRGLVDDRMLTVDLTRMMELKTPLAQITAFFLLCRQHKTLTWAGWMRTVANAKYLKRFKQHFTIALQELEAHGYDVSISGDEVLIRR